MNWSTRSCVSECRCSGWPLFHDDVLSKMAKWSIGAGSGTTRALCVKGELLRGYPVTAGQCGRKKAGVTTEIEPYGASMGASTSRHTAVRVQHQGFQLNGRCPAPNPYLTFVYPFEEKKTTTNSWGGIHPRTNNKNSYLKVTNSVRCL